MEESLQNLTPEQINDLACKLGEIERHLVEDTDLISEIHAMKEIDLSYEIDGYESVIEALYKISQYVEMRLQQDQAVNIVSHSM